MLIWLPLYRPTNVVPRAVLEPIIDSSLYVAISNFLRGHGMTQNTTQNLVEINLLFVDLVLLVFIITVTSLYCKY